MTDKIITTFENLTKVVGIERLNDVIYVATEYRVFKIVNDELVPLKIIWEE